MWKFNPLTGTFLKGYTYTPTLQEFMKGLMVVDIQDSGVRANFRAIYARLRRYCRQPRAVRAAALGALWLFYGHSPYRTEKVLVEYLSDNSSFVKEEVYVALWKYARG